MKKLLISGYHGFHNLGDEAILESILQIFRQAASRAGRPLEITVLSANPPKTAQRNGVRAVGRTNIIAILKAIHRCDLFLSGGGSLLQDKTGYGLSVLYYLGLVFLARLFGKPVVLYAHGVGPITKRFNRFLARWIINGVDLVSVRDADSQKELRALGVQKTPIHLTVDPAFYLLFSSEDGAEDGAEKAGRLLAGFPRGQPLLGISLRDWWGPDHYPVEIARAADRFAAELGAAVVFIPFFPEKDLAVSRRTAALMQQETYLVEEELTPLEALSLFSRLDLLIGVRLHALIFAAMAGTPMVGVGYDPKVYSFLARLGLGSALGVEGLQAGELWERCQKIWQQREAIKGRLRQLAAEYSQESKRFGESVYRQFLAESEKGGPLQ